MRRTGRFDGDEGLTGYLLAWTRWKGRLRRRSFLWMALAATTAFIVLFVFLRNAFGEGSTLLLYPPWFAVMLSLCLRRLHDQARGGWWLLAALVPVLGPLLLAFLLAFKRGTEGENQYGEDPRTRGRDYLRVAIHEPA
jgi:uncharacterized membrane protein YhaH (DUF805 family)